MSEAIRISIYVAIMLVGAALLFLAVHLVVWRKRANPHYKAR